MNNWRWDQTSRERGSFQRYVTSKYNDVTEYLTSLPEVRSRQIEAHVSASALDRNWIPVNETITCYLRICDIYFCLGSRRAGLMHFPDEGERIYSLHELSFDSDER